MLIFASGWRARKFLERTNAIARGAEAKILHFSNLTAEQAFDSLLAIFAFVPAMVCSGYVVAWFTNLHDFRARSIVERIFWSLPLSLAVSTITSVLIGKFMSLTAVVVFDWIALLLWLGLLIAEGRQLRRAGSKWNIGWRPLGGKALALVILWIVGAILSLVDIQKGHQLFMSAAMLDQGYRVNWTESVLHTGIPPANSLYMYEHPAPMRNYYFWYVLCAAAAKMSHLPVRGILIASTVWAGLLLAALLGLYLKHFLAVGERLRKQYLCSVCLLAVGGLDVCAVCWNLFAFHIQPQAEISFWSTDPIFSWLNNLLWSPNHIAGMVSCFFAFLLGWIGAKAEKPGYVASVVLIACALSTAFGLSIYVTLAFFLVMVVWACWQLVICRTHRHVFLLAAGGASAIILLIPYLLELRSNSSAMKGGSFLALSVREMIPPGTLAATAAFRGLAAIHPTAALSLAKILLLVPGYALELGFGFVIMVLFIVRSLRARTRMTRAEQCLLLIAVATLPFVSFMRSGVLKSNDFVWRGSLLIQFALVLLGSQVVLDWNLGGALPSSTSTSSKSKRTLRSVLALSLVLGVMSIASEALMLRFVTAVGEWNTTNQESGPETRSYSHNAYISSIGYSQLNAAIARDAVVQFNPHEKEPFWVAADQLGVAHQTVIAGDQPWCGAELGGDPRPCPAMAAALDRLFNGASASEARATCNQYGIQYLIVRVYDPAWRNRDGWVWTLEPVVDDPEFRALKCR